MHKTLPLTNVEVVVSPPQVPALVHLAHHVAGAVLRSFQKTKRPQVYTREFPNTCAGAGARSPPSGLTEPRWSVQEGTESEWHGEEARLCRYAASGSPAAGEGMGGIQRRGEERLAQRGGCTGRTST